MSGGISVNIEDPNGAAEVEATEVTVGIDIDGPSTRTAIEVPVDTEATDFVEPLPQVVEVDSSPSTTVSTTVETDSVVEVDVPVDGELAVPVPDIPPVLEVEVPGEQGPKGDDGADGATGPRGIPGPSGAGASYTHSQNTPSATWTINHNLGFNPSVQVEDSAGTNVEGEIDQVDADNVVITFTTAFGGVAYLS